MKITADITMRGVVAAFGRRAINDVMRDAFMGAGMYWVREFLPKHFTREGAREYDYKPRKGEKARPGSKRFKRIAGPAEKAAGEILPLVFTGELKRQAVFYRVTAGATAKRVYATVTLPNAQGINRLPAEYRDDISRVSDAEWKVLIDVINDEIGRGLKALSTWQRHRIR